MQDHRAYAETIDDRRHLFCVSPGTYTWKDSFASEERSSLTYYRRRLFGLALVEILGICALAFLLYYLQVSGAASLADMWATDRVVAYALLLIIPLLVFVPLNLILKLGPTWAIGTASWSSLGYILIFATPSTGHQSASVFTYMAFLTLLFIALSSAFAVPIGAMGKWLFPPSPMAWLRALRQGALISLFVVALLAMSPLGLLNWLNVFLLFTIIALTEFLFLARS